jgi:hypothetical protein
MLCEHLPEDSLIEHLAIQSDLPRLREIKRRGLLHSRLLLALLLFLA